MSDYTPKVPVSLQIRKIIFENYNDTDDRFNNDDIFEYLRYNGDIDPDWIIDDLEPAINELCDAGVTRNIAQNFTTIWLKLFEKLERVSCHSCSSDIFTSPEEKTCPGCRSAL